MIGEHSWITFLCCQCRCQIFKGERYFRTVFYYNFQTVLVAIVCLKAETSHYGAARGFYRPSLGSGPDLAMRGPWALFFVGALNEQAWLEGSCHLTTTFDISKVLAP